MNVIEDRGSTPLASKLLIISHFLDWARKTNNKPNKISIAFRAIPALSEAAMACRFRFLNWAKANLGRICRARATRRFDEASEGGSEEVRYFCTPRANFRLTAFFGDFRLNHQRTKTHKYARRVSEVWKNPKIGAVTICYLGPMLTREIQLDTFL
jgi:hypothetical protein